MSGVQSEEEVVALEERSMVGGRDWVRGGGAVEPNTAA